MKNLYDTDESESIRKFFELVCKSTDHPLTEEKLNSILWSLGEIEGVQSLFINGAAIIEQSKSSRSRRKVNPHLINAIELNISELRSALVDAQVKQTRVLLNLTITTLEYCRTALRGL